MLSMKLVETQYALVMDDDFLVTTNTNISLLMEILETTDVSVVGGTADGHDGKFEGAFRIMQNQDGAHLEHYPEVFYEQIKGKKCYVSDVVKNVFLAKREDVIAAGSWNAERPYFEHTDLFLRLKKANTRTAFCPEVVFKGNEKHTSDLKTMRMKEFDYYNTLLRKNWGIIHNYKCGVKQAKFEDYLSSNSCKLPGVIF